MNDNSALALELGIIAMAILWIAVVLTIIAINGISVH